MHIMKKTGILIITAAMLCCGTALNAQNGYDGYYMDVFMDGGLSLTSKQDLPSARALGLSIETLKTAKKSQGFTFLDTLAQKAAFIGDDNDSNGRILYPDGSPRYKMMFVNGGSGGGHGRSITEEGRANIRKYVSNGGSYLGNCAGAYVATTGTHTKIHPEYIGIYPSICTNAKLQDTYVSIDVPENSPMLRYADFGGDYHIDSVYHNGGCFMHYDDLIEGSEILFNYNYPPKPMHGNGAVWAYKANDRMGRVICCGPHPESAYTGEKLDMMTAMLAYAIEGNGAPRIKGELVNYKAREMVRSTEDNDPDYTKIGDRQYHHFYVNVPENTDTLRVALKSVRGMDDYDMNIYASYEGPAFRANAQYKNIKLGFDKVLTIVKPKAGKLYISVFCVTTVDSEDTFYGARYSGRLDVLNGVPYLIEVQY